MSYRRSPFVMCTCTQHQRQLSRSVTSYRRVSQARRRVRGTTSRGSTLTTVPTRGRDVPWGRLRTATPLLRHPSMLRHDNRKRCDDRDGGDDSGRGRASGAARDSRGAHVQAAVTVGEWQPGVHGPCVDRVALYSGVAAYALLGCWWNAAAGTAAAAAPPAALPEHGAESRCLFPRGVSPTPRCSPRGAASYRPS